MNIGCDIVENKRLKNKNKRFIELILTKEEILEYKEKGFYYLCGRFAAKEAIMKCLDNTKNYTFHDIIILNDQNGRPYCKNITNVKISISHEKKYTIAYAIIY